MMYKDRNLIHISETESTNQYLQILAQSEKLADETVVLTDIQTAGRGQMGNAWESEPYKNLTFSILYYPKQLPANQPFVIAELAALCVKRTLDKYVSNIKVKWPNDIYWNDKKICGILIENSLSEGFISQSVIGAGVNLNQEKFVSNATNPVSLKQITGKTYDRLEVLKVLQATFHEIRKLLELNGSACVHREYEESLYRLGDYHLYRDKNGDFEARIHHVELSGYLVLERRNGEFSKYAFKEVSYL